MLHGIILSQEIAVSSWHFITQIFAELMNVAILTHIGASPAIFYKALFSLGLQFYSTTVRNT